MYIYLNFEYKGPIEEKYLFLALSIFPGIVTAILTHRCLTTTVAGFDLPHVLNNLLDRRILLLFLNMDPSDDLVLINKKRPALQLFIDRNIENTAETTSSRVWLQAGVYTQLCERTSVTPYSEKTRILDKALVFLYVLWAPMIIILALDSLGNAFNNAAGSYSPFPDPYLMLFSVYGSLVIVLTLVVMIAQIERQYVLELAILEVLK